MNARVCVYLIEADFFSSDNTQSSSKAQFRTAVHTHIQQLATTSIITSTHTHSRSFCTDHLGVVNFLLF